MRISTYCWLKYFILAIQVIAVSCNSDKSEGPSIDPEPDTPLIHDDNPAWSPNGRFVAYSHYVLAPDESGNFFYWQLWLYDSEADSSYLFLYPAMGPRWSQDNSMLAFGPGPLTNIYYYDFAADTVRRITYDGYHGGFDLAPDGRSIVDAAGPAAPENDLWTIGLDGAYQRNITPGPLWGNDAHWSWHSGRILFNRALDGDYYQFAISDSFGNYLGVVHPTPWFQYQACWGPEDTVVAITNGMTSDYRYKRTRIYLANRRSGSLDFFTLGWSPDWSHDGRWLAFADRAENPVRFTIWVMRVDGTGKREISRRSYASDDTITVSSNIYPRCVLPEAVKARLRGQ